jgi:Type II secretion system protein C
VGKVKLSPWLIASLLLAGVCLVLVASLSRQLAVGPPLPPAPEPRTARVAGPEAGGVKKSEDSLGAYNVIVSKHLFNPSRSEATQAAAAPAPPPLPPKPVLHGLVVDGPKSVAFLEDAGSKRTLGYRVGDSIAGGQLVQIGTDRVLIRRPDGQMDVLLNDPTKVKVVAEPTPGPASRSRTAPGPSTSPRAPFPVPGRAPSAVPPGQPPIDPQPQPPIDPQPQIMPNPQDADE